MGVKTPTLVHFQQWWTLVLGPEIFPTVDLERILIHQVIASEGYSLSSDDVGGQHVFEVPDAIFEHQLALF